MSTITPSSLTIEPGLTQQFTQSGITSPIWFLTGVGTLSTTGFYTAPGGAGSATVRVAPTFWASVGGGMTLNSNDTLTGSSAAGFTYSNSVASLSAVGDYVDFIYQSSAFYLEVFRTGQVYRYDATYAYYNSNGQSGVISSSVGDVIRFEWITGDQIRVKNMTTNTVLWTFSQTPTGPVTPRLYLNTNSLVGITIQVPLVGGSGIQNYDQAIANVTVTPPLLTTKDGLEIYCQSDSLGLANNAAVTSFTDLSGNARHLTAKTSDYPLFKTAGNYIQFNGTDSSPLSTSNIPITVVCGFMVAKYDDATFPNTADGYKGLLSGLTDFDILVGNANTTKFFDLSFDLYEFRSDDRIYPDSDAPAPMQNWRLIFFRFWRSLTISGVQIAQQRNLTARKWKGGIKFLALFSKNQAEATIRKNAQTIADYYGITLADVYPYQADRRGLTELPVQNVNFYDPPEGERISEVLSESKRTLDLKFSSRRSDERKAMKTFHAAHYDTALPFIYRDYSDYPPEDIEGYFDSQYQLEGSLNNYDYGFKFREK